MWAPGQFDWEYVMNIPMNIHDWPTLLLLGSIGLLAAGAVLQAVGKSGPTPPQPEPANSIGQYRPRAYH